MSVLSDLSFREMLPIPAESNLRALAVYSV